MMQIEYATNVNFESIFELTIYPHFSSFAPLVIPKDFYEKQTLQETSILKEKVDNIAILENFYNMENPLEIKSFLFTHDNLIPILFEAYAKIKQIFGDVVELYLELHQDPEEDWEELFIVIKSPYEAERARELIDKLADEWFLDIIDKTGNKLCITEEPL